MSGKMKKRLVIDASVIQSAGNTGHPVSRMCRDFLDEVLNICHRAVMTDEIKEEWDRHLTGFTINWKKMMEDRGKIYRIRNFSINWEFRKKIEDTAENEKAKKEIEKDGLLYDAALQTDNIVVSRDDTVRKHLIKACETVNELKCIVWVNPTIPNEKPLEWLKTGAKPEKEKRLGYKFKKTN